MALNKKASNQQTYKTHIESIKPRFVNEFENEKIKLL